MTHTLARLLPVALLAALAAGCAAPETAEHSAASPFAALQYDEVWVVSRHFPKRDGEWRLFDKDGKPNPRVIDCAGRVEYEDQLQGVAELLQKPENFSDAGGDSDSSLQLYSLVFYKDGQAVLELTPNLADASLGAVPEPAHPDAEKSYAWSWDGFYYFIDLAHDALACIDSPDREGALPPAAGRDSPVTRSYDRWEKEYDSAAAATKKR